MNIADWPRDWFARVHADPLPPNTLIWYDGPWDVWLTWGLPASAVKYGWSACVYLELNP